MDKTYIMRITNKQGYEWIEDYRGGREREEIEVIVATSLNDAVDKWLRHCYMDTIYNELFETLQKNRKAPSPKPADLLPLNIAISEIAAINGDAVPITLSDADIETAIQQKIDLAHAEAGVWVDDEAKAAAVKQQAVDKLKIEAQKLGITVEDLR